MSFADYPAQQQVVTLLQRSLERGRLGHAYLFTGDRLEELENVARTLAKTLNCAQPRRSPGGTALDSCDQCLSCRKIDALGHPDVQWIRPEMKSRIIAIDQVRELSQTLNLKPTEAPWKVGVVVSADRLTANSANAFLKTLEEPPRQTVLILLSTDPTRLLDTILSRCLRLNFAAGDLVFEPAQLDWLAGWLGMVKEAGGGLLGRYQLLGHLLGRLGAMKEEIDRTLTGRSPLERHDDVEAKLREKWEEELEAAIEAEYRRQRIDILSVLQWWLRDVWLHTLSAGEDLVSFPQHAEVSRQVAARLAPADALENLAIVERTQRLLQTNVQEALALEVGLLRLKL